MTGSLPNKELYCRHWPPVILRLQSKTAFPSTSND